MEKMLVFFVILSLSYASSHAQLGIVNGTDAAEGEFKFVVSIRENNSHVCGGSILNARYVLTAGHCFCNTSGVPEDVRNISIQYGSIEVSPTTERSVPVSHITCNHSLHGIGFHGDMAVLKLANDLPDDKTWEPVKLLETYNSSIENKGVIIGWGYLSFLGPYSHILQKLDVDIYNDTVCQKYDPEQHVCLGATVGGACYGDSGSPLLSLDNYQIGLTSYGTYKCGIANKRVPNVYTRIDNFYTWIKDNSKI